MFGPFPQMKNEDLEENQIDGHYDVPENMTLEQYVQIWAWYIQKIETSFSYNCFGRYKLFIQYVVFIKARFGKGKCLAQIANLAL